MASRTIRCPACGARLSDGAGFDIVVPYKSASCNAVEGIDRHGYIVLGGGDAGHPTWFGQPELICGTCGHQWKTTLPWGGVVSEES